MTLGEKIRQLRSEQNLTQPELATKAGIEQSYLSKLENGKGVPSYDILDRIGAALGLSGMELVNSLSLSYVEENLAHLPEVAAEYRSIKAKQDRALKQRFVIAALLMVLGLGVFFAGSTALFFENNLWTYRSDGVIREGEPVFQFSRFQIPEIGETNEEAMRRIRGNTSRLDVEFLNIHRFRGEWFVEEVEGGRRLYDEQNRSNLNRPENAALMIAGGMLALAGLFLMAYVLLFGVFRRS